ncbi:hypothetical protein BH23CHL7_BH23CHL7_06370 [soil metagenome]
MTLVVAVVLVAAAAVAAVRYLPLMDEARELRALAGRVADEVGRIGIDVDRPALERVATPLAEAERRLYALTEVLEGDPLVGLLRDFPPTREVVHGADAVVGAAAELLEASHLGLGVGERYVGIQESRAAGGNSSSPLPSLVALMSGSSVDVAQMAVLVESARAKLAPLPANLPGPLAEARSIMLDRIERYGPILTAYTEVDQVLPTILGWEEPKRYLFLAQNPAELRPTGGFIGTYGIVGFNKGEITERGFHDVYNLDGQEGMPYVEPPAPLRDHLLGPYSWELADANWYPDFPMSAQQALRLYVLESGDSDIDGVIAVTTLTMDDLLEVTGPVEVPEYDEVVRAGETTFKGLRHTRQSPEPGVNRKTFLDIFAGHFFERLLSMPPRQWPALLEKAASMGAERKVMVWLADPEVQAVIAEWGWDGRVRQDPGDYLYVVDSNVAPATKLNLAVTRSLTARVQLDQFGNAEWDLEVGWTNVVRQRTGELYEWLLQYQNRDTYGNFVRVLTPERSRILQVSGGSFVRLTGPALEEVEAGRRVYGNYVMVPPGSTKVRYRWSSPYAADIGVDGSGEYHLVIQKQPGMAEEVLSLQIALPDGTYVVEHSDGLSIVGNVATLHATLERDLMLSLRFRQSE